MAAQFILSCLLLALAAAAGAWLRWRSTHQRLLEVATRIPGPTPLPLVGNALLFMCQPEEFVRVLTDLMREYGDVLRFWLGPDLNVGVSNPDDLKILLSSSKTSVKGPQYKYMADLLGGGILSGSGLPWRKHRKIATPNYGKRAIEGYASVFHQEVDLLLSELRSSTGRQIDIYRPLVRTTSYTVCQTLMGLSKEQTINLPHIHHIIEETFTHYSIVFYRMTKWYLQLDPVFWMTGYYKRQKNFIKTIRDFSQSILQHRMNYLKTLEDRNEVQLESSEEDGLTNTELSVIDRFILSQEMSREELLQETFTVFTTSQEASAKTASYILMMMAYHPDCQKKLYAEIKSVMGDRRKHVSDEDLKQMPYLDMVFKEVLRLFPIGAFLQRTIAEDIAISSGFLPAGCSLVIPIYHLHRDPRFWERPDDFDPERFSPDNVKTRHPYSYIPFSLGPMDCLGRNFATKLIKTICVKLLREFEVKSEQTYKDLKVAIVISAVSVNGYHVKLIPRN